MGPDATPTDHPEAAAAGPDSFATDHWDELLCDQMRAPLIDNDEPPQDQMGAVPIDREEPRAMLSLPRLISGAAFLNGGRPPLSILAVDKTARKRFNFVARYVAPLAS